MSNTANMQQPGFGLPLFIAILLHFSVIILLVVNLNFKHKSQPILQTSQPVKIVEAVKLDQTKLQAEIDRLKETEQIKKQKEEERVKQLQHKAMEAQKKQELEKKKLTELQQQKKKLEQEKIAEQKLAEKKLAELKVKQKTEEERIKKIQKEADIASKKKLEEQKKLVELEKKRKDETNKIEEDKLRMQLEEERLMQQQLAEEHAQIKAQQTKQYQSEIDKYTALITQAVGQHWIVPDNLDKETSCVLLIRVSPGGAVIDVKLLRSSGDPVLDRSAEAAVFKASPLPVPEDAKLFETFREIRLLVRPEGYLT